MKIIQFITKAYISIFQVVTTILVGILAKALGKVVTHNPPEIDARARYLFISNHTSYFDVYAIFLGLKIKTIWHASPMKFMTAERIYYSWMKPFIFSGGGYPAKSSRRPNYDSVEESLQFIEKGYNVTMFPEGGIVRGVQRPARPGVKRLIDESDVDLSIVLVRLHWAGSGFKKRLVVSYGQCSDTSSPESIMEQVYRLPINA